MSSLLLAVKLGSMELLLRQHRTTPRRTAPVKDMRHAAATMERQRSVNAVPPLRSQSAVTT
jgi:hypothetical protein